jgi:hypothetical protein
MIDSYDKLTLGRYEELLALRDRTEDENELTLEVLAALSGKSVDELMEMPLDDYYKIRAGGAFLLTQPVPRRLRRTYRLGAWRLRPVRTVRKMTTAQFIDFQEWAAQEKRGMAETLSCFLVPKGRAYGEGYDPAEVIGAIRERMPMRDAVALDAFFFGLSVKSTADTLRSLERRMSLRQRMTKEARTYRRALRALRRSGAGWRRWTPWLSLPATLGTISTRDQSWSS